MKKLISLFLSLLLLLSLVSCGQKPVMEYGTSKITTGEFQYYLATYKARFAQTYSDFKDNAAFYRQPIGDVTAEEFLFDAVVHNVSMSLLCDGLFKEYGLSLPASVTASVDDYIESFLDDYAGGNKNVLNQTLSTYGINVKMFREILLRDERSSAVFNHLYGTDGVIGLSDSDRTAYLEENYVRVRHIYVNNKFTYAYDENGEPVYGSDGYQEQMPLTAEELSRKTAVIDAIDEALADGMDFDEIYAVSSEDQYYANGYYLTRDMNFVSDVVSSAFELEIGEWIKLESDVGTHYIKRLPLEEKPWEEEANADFFPDYDETVAAELFTAMLEEKLSEIVLDEELLAGYSVEGSPTNYRFQ